ncbi:MAG: serine protease [Myxococcota bacterium]
MKKLAVVGFLLASIIACGDEGEEFVGLETRDTTDVEPIINGEPASSFTVARQGIIFVDGSFVCGASYLGRVNGKFWVLTAAHCFDGLPASRDIKIGFGKRSRFDYGPAALVSVVGNPVIHPRYQPGGFVWDFALVRVDRQPPGARSVSLGSRDVRPNERVRVSGFGAKEDGFFSETVLQAEVAALSDNRCEQLFAESVGDVEIDPSQLCTIDVSRDSGICFGDSGGPLLRRNGEIAGVASFVVGPCRVDVPNGWARVSAARDWIRQRIR